jgi:hypothetical protein
MILNWPYSPLKKAKINLVQGEGVLFEEESLGMVFGQRADHFNFDKFKYMCIMSGTWMVYDQIQRFT